MKTSLAKCSPSNFVLKVQKHMDGATATTSQPSEFKLPSLHSHKWIKSFSFIRSENNFMKKKLQIEGT